MNKNRLTLKKLNAELDKLRIKQEIDNLNSNKSFVDETKSLNKSSILNIFKQSSMLHFWIITGILGYARKIPFLSKIITFFSLWYGKTTWWQIFSKLRKIFVIINALIGVYVVFKAVGFSFDNMLIGFMAMGHTYFEILGSLTNKLFNWFLNLFDHKIVPNIPNNKPNNSVIDSISKPIESLRNIETIKRNSSWNPLSQDKPKFSLRDLYGEGPVEYFKIRRTFEPTPWYSDTSTWLWILGIGCTIGLAYFGYKLIFDPTIISGIDSNINNPGSPGPSGSVPSPDITITDKVSKGIGDYTKIITKPFRFIGNKLNPFNYVLTSTELNNQYQYFMDMQNDPVYANRNYYPFTENNPFNPWYKKVKTAVFGESTFDSLQRLKDKAYAERIYESIRISKGKFKMVEGLTPASSVVSNTSGSTTPVVHLPQVLKSGWDSVTPTAINKVGIMDGYETWNKVRSLPATPKYLPTLSESAINELIEQKTNQLVSAANVKTYSEVVEGITTHPNKYAVLADAID